jgi:hypothetical protein
MNTSIPLAAARLKVLDRNARPGKRFSGGEGGRGWALERKNILLLLLERAVFFWRE